MGQTEGSTQARRYIGRLLDLLEGWDPWTNPAAVTAPVAVKIPVASPIAVAKALGQSAVPTTPAAPG